MKQAVVVSTARTPIGKAYRGAWNNTEGPTMAAHAIGHAIERANITADEVEDVILGCALQQGTNGNNIGRLAALAAGMPVEVPGMSVNRQCSSGMVAIGLAANAIINNEMDIVVAGGLESVSLVQNEHMNAHREKDQQVLDHAEHAYMSMIETAETVAKRYRIERASMDEYGVRSQARTAAAQQAGRYLDEIVPMTATKMLVNKETKEVGYEEVTLEKDEGNRPGTTIEDLQNLRTVFEGGVIAAGNASQLSDGASVSVIMSRDVAEKVCNRWVCTAVWRWLVANPMKWVSGRCLRCRSCSRNRGLASMTSICGSSTKPLPYKCSIAATGSVFPTRS